jgi:hypothetical protein
MFVDVPVDLRYSNCESSADLLCRAHLPTLPVANTRLPTLHISESRTRSPPISGRPAVQSQGGPPHLEQAPLLHARTLKFKPLARLSLTPCAPKTQTASARSATQFPCRFLLASFLRPFCLQVSARNRAPWRPRCGAASCGAHPRALSRGLGWACPRPATKTAPTHCTEKCTVDAWVFSKLMLPLIPAKRRAAGLRGR